MTDKRMTDKYDYIVLSPHPDDAALSCAGFIFDKIQKGFSVLLLTIFSGIPEKPYPKIADYFHQRWELEESPVKVRKQEDKLGSQVLGTKLAELNYLDCIYRRDENGNEYLNSHEDLFAELTASEHKLIDSIAEDLKDNFKGKLIVPIGMGNHRDHLIARQAAEASGLNISAYYEEYPYWARDDRDHSIMEPSGFSRMELLLSAASTAQKKQAINCYKHPIKSLFGSNTIEESSKDYSKLVNKEFIWQKE